MPLTPCRARHTRRVEVRVLGILVCVANVGGSAHASPPSHRSSWLVLLIACLSMVGPFTIDTMFPAFPDMQRDFGVDATAMQQSISVYLVAFAVTSLFHGPISDAAGRRPVILTGTLCYTLASVLCALAPTMAWMLTGRALQGLFAGAGMIVGRTVVRDVFEGDAAQRTMSHVSMIFGVAPALAPIVGGWLLGWSNWRSIFWFLAGFGLRPAGGLPRCSCRRPIPLTGALRSAHSPWCPRCGALPATPTLPGCARCRR